MADVLDGDHRNRPKNYAPYSLTPSACLFPEGPVAPAGGQDYLEMIDCELFDTPGPGLSLAPTWREGKLTRREPRARRNTEVAQIPQLCRWLCWARGEEGSAVLTAPAAHPCSAVLVFLPA